MINRIPAMPLGKGDQTAPYKVGSEDTVVEFSAEGSVSTKMADGSTTTTTVVKGGRYSLSGVVEITSAPTFSIG